MTTYDENLLRLMQVALEHRLIFNPDRERVDKVVGLMSDNFDQYSLYYCPCKQSHPLDTSKDVTCPCPELDAEIAETGYCFCKLFFAAETEVKPES
jgi:ferredoxin-thioredoxin reductase catalytic subunit